MDPALRRTRESNAPAEAPPRRDADSPDGVGSDALREQLERERTAWESEKEILLEMLAQQQRVAQAGLITAGLSHDIRNQMQIMLCSAEMALITGDVEEMKTALHDVARGCQDVAETTHAFLAFARRRSEADSQRFALSEVIEHCRRLVGPLANGNRVRLICDIATDGLVQGERRMAIQAVVNLATNAVKACTGQKHATVTLTASRPFPDVCRLTIADTGPGVPEKIRARLFRPFVGTGEASGGNGLGLFIVRQAVLELDGRIAVKTSPTGSIFRLDLPAVDTSEPSTGPI